jgi:peptide/nickel transport system permease protein
MTTPNFTIEELPSAGVRRKGVWYHFRTFCRRYPLGAVGAAITLVFLFCAIFAEFVTGMDPYTTNAASSMARAFR